MSVELKWRVHPSVSAMSPIAAEVISFRVPTEKRLIASNQRHHVLDALHRYALLS